MFGIGFWELVLILVIALIALGPEKLPDFAKSLGRGMRELRDAANGVRRVLEEETGDLKDELEDIKNPVEQVRHDIHDLTKKETAVRDREEKAGPEAAKHGDDEQGARKEDES